MFWWGLHGLIWALLYVFDFIKIWLDWGSWTSGVIHLWEDTWFWSPKWASCTDWLINTCYSLNIHWKLSLLSVVKNNMIYYIVLHAKLISYIFKYKDVWLYIERKRLYRLSISYFKTRINDKLYREIVEIVLLPSEH